MESKSKLAAQAKLELVALTQSMTPEQRLEAFLTHSQLMMGALYGGRRNSVQSTAVTTVRSEGFGQSALLLLDAIVVLARERIDYAVIGAVTGLRGEGHFARRLHRDDGAGTLYINPVTG